MAVRQYPWEEWLAVGRKKPLKLRRRKHFKVMTSIMSQQIRNRAHQMGLHLSIYVTETDVTITNVRKAS